MLLIGVLGYAQAMIAATRSQALTHEQSLATDAARQVIEEMHALAFGNVFRQYNSTGADDLAGGPAPGSGFAIDGLDAAPGDLDGLPGEVLFPTVAGAPGALREDLVDSEFGTPRDLDGDLATDASDHSGDYQLLPVVVRVRWRNRTGSAEVRLRTILADLP